MNGERVRAARERAGLTQTALARRAGLSQSMVGAIERGDRTASRAAALALAHALGVPLAALSDPPAPPPDSPATLLAHLDTPRGLRALALDRALGASLRVTPAEWRALHSLVLPAPATKEGYVALLLTIRLVSGGGAGDAGATGSHTPGAP